MKEGRKPEHPEKTPGDELQKMPHTTAQRFKPQARLEPAQQHWWQARKADMLTVTPRVGMKTSTQATCPDCRVSQDPKPNRLVGLVVKASASRAEDPGFESRWRRDFFGVEPYQ